MKLTMKITLLLVTLSMVFWVVPGCSSKPTQLNTQPSNTVTPSPTVFRVESLAVNPAETNAGVEVIVTARITNTGSIDNNYTPLIRIEDEAGGVLPSFRYQDDIRIPAGATELLSFVVPTERQGRYRVTWGDTSGEFTVLTAAVDESTPVVRSAPDFTGKDVVTGDKITLSQFEGSVVLLNFVNYGCDPATSNKVSKQLLAIKEIRDRGKDFIPISVFCGCCPPEVLRDFATENELNWPWLLDTNNSIVPKYTNYVRSYGYPTLVYIDNDMNIIAKSGYADAGTLSIKLDEIIAK